MKLNFQRLLCAGEESMLHFFFLCPVSSRCWDRIKRWLQWRCRSESMEAVLKWIDKRKDMSKFRKDVLRAVLAASVYNIWKARNGKLWNQTNVSIDIIVQLIKHESVARIKQVMSKKSEKKGYGVV